MNVEPAQSSSPKFDLEEEDVFFDDEDEHFQVLVKGRLPEKRRALKPGAVG